MKLYHFPMTRAFRPRWLLEELEADHELVRVDIPGKQNRSPEYLAIHPLGSVPALQDGEVTLFESAAICMYLAERFPDRSLAPPAGSPERAAYYQWICHATETLEPAVVPPYYRAFRVSRDERAQVADDGEREKLARLAAPLNPVLAERPFLLGEALSAADVVLGGVLHWAAGIGQLRGQAVLEAYLGRLEARPAFQRALS